MKISADNPFANPKPAVNKVKRLGWTLAIAVLVHLVIIFSVDFKVNEVAEVSTSLDVILVSFSSDKTSSEESAPDPKPAAADVEEPAHQSQTVSAAPKPAPAPVAKPEIKPEPTPVKPTPVKPVVTTQVTPPPTPVVVSTPAPAKPKPVQKPQPQPKPAPKVQPKIVSPAPAAKPATTQPQAARKPVTFSRDQLSASLAGIQADQAFSRQQPSQGPRVSRHHLATSKRDISAWYRDAWRKKVERIGNLNYPEEARRQGIYGSLRVSVLINKDGSLQQMRVLQSSGHKVLDQAALNIVRLSAPFTPFSGDLAAKYDQLEIIRTWRFEHGDRLSSQ